VEKLQKSLAIFFLMFMKATQYVVSVELIQHKVLCWSNIYLWGYSFPIPLEILFAIAAKSIQKNLGLTSAILFGLCFA